MQAPRWDTGAGCLLIVFGGISIPIFVVWFFACLIGGQCQ